jgi:hypothetical protein
MVTAEDSEWLSGLTVTGINRGIGFRLAVSVLAGSKFINKPSSILKLIIAEIIYKL